MNTPLNILRHPEVDKTVRNLPWRLVESLKEFEQRLKCGGDLSDFVNTQPFSREDALGKRSRLEHYHLPPCEPECYLIWLVRTVDTAYLLEVSKHPQKGKFTDSGVEERLYPRLADLHPELANYKLPGTYRSVLPVQKKDIYGSRFTKGVPSIVPVRSSDSDYLPLGQLNKLSEGRNRIGIVVGTFEIPTEEIPEAASDCIDCEEHPERESLTLFIGGWVSHSGVYRKETEQILLWFCELHNVVMITGSRREPTIMALKEEDYRQLVDELRRKFPSVNGKEQELAETVDMLIEHFPLYRP